jgi:hypothetical protein
MKDMVTEYSRARTTSNMERNRFRKENCTNYSRKRKQSKNIQNFKNINHSIDEVKNQEKLKTRFRKIS